MLDEEEYEKKQEQTKKSVLNSALIMSEKVQSKLLSTNEIAYPLPRPSYSGYPLEKISIFLSGLFLLGTLNTHQKNYELSIRVQDKTDEKKIKITEKNIFLNQFISFPIQ